jgi:hypothetical protein
MNILTEKRQFDQGLNADDSHSDLTPGQYFNGFNFRAFTAEDGQVSGLQPIHSTTSIFSLLPPGANHCIGSCVDESQQRIVWANWNIGGEHGIYIYDTINLSGRAVLLSSWVSGGLNFDRFHLIHSSFVLNDCWYFTDNFNEPRRVNLDIGVKYSVSAGVAVTNSLSIPISRKFIITLPALVSEMTLTLIRLIDSPPLHTITRVFTDVPLDWTNYPGISASQVVFNGFSAYLTNIGMSPSRYTLTILGDGSIQFVMFAPFTWPGDTGLTATINLGFQFSAVSFASSFIYTAPINPSVIAWVRRPPGLPPTQAKFNQTNPVIVGNFIAREAFLFCYRYQYRNFELSTLSPLSTLANYNVGGNVFSSISQPLIQYNRIDVTLPLLEQVDQDVLRVDLVAVNMNSGVYSIIRTWDKGIPADLTAINAHNAGIPLSYSFYNNQSGIVLDSAYSVKPFDSIPPLAETTERAKNRAFLGGYKIGIDTPATTSLQLSLKSSTVGSAVTGEWFFFKFHQHNDGNGSGNPPVDRDESVYIMLITNLQDLTKQGYYMPTIYAPVFPSFTFGGHGPPFEASWDYSQLTFLGSNLDSVMMANEFNGIIGIPNWVNTQLQYVDQNASSIITAVPGGNTGTGPSRVFKSGAMLQGAITFYDNAQRKCGALTNQSLQLTIPDITYETPALTASIQWTLSNGNAVSEIPVEAYYYSVDITKCLRTRFFVQSRGKNAIYAGKDSGGNYTFTTNAYDAFTCVGCAFDSTLLFSYQMGYVFNEGDVLKVHIKGNATVFYLNIIGTSGNWIITELQNLGTLDNTVKFLFEIYTPYRASSSEPFYEVGQIYSVSTPGTPNRSYSALLGNIQGDVNLLLRDDGTGLAFYFAEAMSPNDKMWRIWNTDSGRPNFIDKIGAANKTGSIAWSNVFTQGAQNNGLSTFDALDTLDLSADFGDLQKLSLTSKIQREGSVMLAICRSETVSLYLGETQVAAPQGNAFLSTSIGVIGTIYPLKGSYGTGDPASVQQWRGDVFYFDRYNKVVVQYSDNGLEPVSQYKMRTFWRKFSLKYCSLSQAQIEAFGSRPFVIGGIDPFNGEYLLSIPQVEASNPNGLLPGGIAGDPQNLFDVYDGMAKTMVFKIEKNFWLSPCNYCAESLVYLGDRMYGFNSGIAHLHNDTAVGYNVFYGLAFPSIILFPGNMLRNTPKLVNAINVEADFQPGDCYVYTKYPNEQISDISTDEWKDLEGVFYSNVKRDRLSPAYLDDNDPTLALNFGDRILAVSPAIQLNFTPTQGFNLKYVNIGYQVSSGHQTIASK